LRGSVVAWIYVLSYYKYMLYCFMHVYIYSSLSFELNSISCNSLWNPPNVLLTFISLSTKHYNAHRKTRRRTVSWRLLRSQETRGRFHKQLQVFCTITLIPYKCATILFNLSLFIFTCSLSLNFTDNSLSSQIIYTLK
jgi:hypothetical protein